MKNKNLKLNISNNDDEEIGDEDIARTPIKQSFEERCVNRGIANLERLSSVNVDEQELLHYFFESANQDYDYSYHWLEKYENVRKIARPVEIELGKKFVEPPRDIPCEFDLLKLITEDNVHKENLVHIPKSLKKLNRYSDILPYKYNIAFLENDEILGNDQKTEEFLSKNYINASFVHGSYEDLTQKLFISTQGPTKATIIHFWKMVIKNKVKHIIMLCKLFEDTRLKCDQYWPNTTEESLKLEDMEINLISESSISEGQLIRRVIEVKYKEIVDKEETWISLTCNQIHVVCWPDHSIPDFDLVYTVIDSLLSIISDHYKEIRREQKESPIIVHCSAGIGRTGTLIALYNIYDSLLRQKKNSCKSFITQNLNALVDDIETMTITSHNKESDKIYFSVFTVVRKLREQRYLSVSDFCQYKLIYQYAYHWIRKNINGEKDDLF